VKVELIYTPGCVECTTARSALQSAAEAAVGGVEWRKELLRRSGHA